MFLSSRILVFGVDRYIHLRITTLDSQWKTDVFCFLSYKVSEELVRIFILLLFDWNCILQVQVAVFCCVGNWVFVGIIGKSIPERVLGIHRNIIGSFSLEVFVRSWNLNLIILRAPHILRFGGWSIIINKELDFPFELLSLNPNGFLVALKLLNVNSVLVMVLFVVDASSKGDALTQLWNVFVNIRFTFSLYLNQKVVSRVLERVDSDVIGGC